VNGENMIQLEQEMMNRHTTFRTGGPAAYYLVPETPEEVDAAIAFAREKQMEFCVIGKGSNLLVSDDGYDGVIIEIGNALSTIRIYEETNAVALAGISLAKMAAFLAENSLTGFEFAAGIPGNLGGGIAMNAGAYGGEIKDVIKSVSLLTESGDSLMLSGDKLELSYRSSVIQKKHYTVLTAVFSLEQGDREEIYEKMKEFGRRRREKQPLEYPSAGSTFKRPEGHFAGKLIEDAGLRGYRIGDAQVSEKHCGFVINRGNAEAAQIYELICHVREEVKKQFGVELEPEVKLLGRF
jgi:UDP-N-acetylmuramate dehydrogenase